MKMKIQKHCCYDIDLDDVPSFQEEKKEVLNMTQEERKEWLDENIPDWDDPAGCDETVVITVV
jgi:hypothetical protein